MNSADICRIMRAENCVDCEFRGDNDKWQPCNENVPEYMPEEQVKKWLIARRDKNV